MLWRLNISGKYVQLASLLLLFSVADYAQAQYFSTGQEAASVHWRQLNSKHVKLVFPDYYEANARKIASYIDTIYHYSSQTLDHQPKKISLIMHTQSATSNALVVWAPKRMEFFTTPPQDMYAQPWLEQLAKHEYRHVVQVDKMNQGLTRVISWIFGQQGTGAVLGLYVPPWFLEGDAVAAETGLGNAGRGRLPLFEMKLRAQLLEKGIYSYDKAVLGSYRDFTPNAYELGYHIVTEGRRLYGPELWSHSLDMVAKRPYMITPFQKGIKDVSGLRKRAFYYECMKGIKERWSMQDRITDHHLTGRSNRWNRSYTNYRHPVFIGDGKILALRTGIDDIQRFVVIDKERREKVIFTPGFIKEETLSYASGKICWAEARPDLRWAHRNATVIRIYDLESRKARTINVAKRLLAPSLSENAEKIVAVHSDSIDQYSLYIIDVSNENIIKKIHAPGNAYPLTPVWAGENHVLTVLVAEAGKSLARIHVETEEVEYLTDWSYIDISQPAYHPPYIFFTGAYSGISNIYAFSLDDREIYKITAARFGATDPWVSDDGRYFLYADYHSDGFNIVEWFLESKSWVPVDIVFNTSIGLHRVLSEQEEDVPAWSEIPELKSPSKRYSKIKNLFNFHSWAPLDIDANNYEINPGVSVMSQNLLSSSFLSAGYRYNLNEGAGKIYASYSYQGWYPIIDIYADYGMRKRFVEHDLTDEITWNETNIKSGLRLPLNLSRGKYYAGIIPSTYLNWIFREMRPGNMLEFAHPNIISAEYGIRLYRQIKRSGRDIYPKWGQSIQLYYYDTPFETPGYSSAFASILRLYLPGMIRHHGLYLYGGYQHQHAGHYFFEDRVSYPSGITDKQDEQLYSFRGTYAFPLAYPDLSLGPLVYWKRVRAALFYDYAVGTNPETNNYYYSMGADLITEVHLLRFLAPFEFGVRSIYLPDKDSISWQFLFGVGF